MHPLTRWLRRQAGDWVPGVSEIDDQDVVDELEDTPLGDGYTSIEERDDE